MKYTLTGLVAALIIGAIGLIVLRSTGMLKLPTRTPSPTPYASIEPNFELTPVESASPSATPAPSSAPTTKGGLTLGETYPTVRPTAKPASKTSSTSTTTTTTTTTVNVIRLFETKSCPVNGTVELRDIHSPLTIKYSVKDGYSARVTIWKTNGETVMNQTLIKNSGVLKTINANDDLKFQIVSDECKSTDDTWLKLTAEK